MEMPVPDARVLARRDAILGPTARRAAGRGGDFRWPGAARL
jgi:hypothetical protein